MKKEMNFSKVSIENVDDQIFIEQDAGNLEAHRLAIHYRQWPLLHAEVMLAHPELAATCFLPDAVVADGFQQHDVEVNIDEDGYLILFRNNSDRDEPDSIVLAPTQIKPVLGAILEMIVRDAAMRQFRVPAAVLNRPAPTLWAQADADLFSHPAGRSAAVSGDTTPDLSSIGPTAR